MEIGSRRWAIADNYIPAWSNGQEPEMTSHDAVCILNATRADARISITIFFSDRDPAGPYVITVPGMRTRHIRFNDLTDPEPIPRGREFASVIESNVPVVVQHTRLDSRQAENALFSTTAFAGSH